MSSAASAAADGSRVCPVDARQRARQGVVGWLVAVMDLPWATIRR